MVKNRSDYGLSGRGKDDLPQKIRGLADEAGASDRDPGK